MNPLHSGNMIRKAAVAVKIRTARIACKIIKAKYIQTVLEADIHNSVADKGFSVIQLIGSTAGVIAAAVDINQHGKVISLYGFSDI